MNNGLGCGLNSCVGEYRMNMTSSRSIDGYHLGNGSGLGLFGEDMIASNVLDFAAGLFSKDPSKVEYDRVRQQAWDSLVIMVANVDQARSTGNLSRAGLQTYIDAITKLMQGLKAYTDKMRGTVDAAWLDPRFHDYYDFMLGVKNSWTQLLSSIPASFTDYLPDMFNSDVPTIDLPTFPGSPVLDPARLPVNRPTTSIAGFDTSSMLLIGAVAVGIYFMSRKRG